MKAERCLYLQDIRARGSHCCTGHGGKEGGTIRGGRGEDAVDKNANEDQSEFGFAIGISKLSRFVYTTYFTVPSLIGSNLKVSVHSTAIIPPYIASISFSAVLGLTLPFPQPSRSIGRGGTRKEGKGRALSNSSTHPTGHFCCR